ncbi:MAG: nuclear transport factor 2 family protein [Planctomycetota bacterium]
MTSAGDPPEVTRAFVDRINDHDVDGMVALMTEDHVFIDALGARTVGRKQMRKAWQSYFEAFPDYRIAVREMRPEGETVTVFGRARATVAGDPKGRMKMPGAWKANIRDGLVAEWRVVADTDD